MPSLIHSETDQGKDMPENNVAYENLKKEIASRSGNINLQNIKNCFSCVIDSRRKLSRVKDLSDILHLLEERDLLDSNNILALISIGNLLENEDIKNLIHGYKKLYVEDDENRVCICGTDKSFLIPIVSQRDNSENENDLDRLETAMESIARNIGGKWSILARHLNVKECYIDEIRQKYPRNMYLQALKSLQIWKNCNKDTATLNVLKCALDARLCKMEGIGCHMLSPIISID